jgi:hypothetical protein
MLPGVRSHTLSTGGSLFNVNDDGAVEKSGENDRDSPRLAIFLLFVGFLTLKDEHRIKEKRDEDGAPEPIRGIESDRAHLRD